MAIEIPYNLNEALIDDIIKDTIHDISTARDVLTQDVDDFVKARNYDNEDFDEFMQIVVNCVAIGEEQMARDRYDINRDSEAYNQVLNAAIPVAVSVFAFRVKSIADRMPDRDYNECSDIADKYKYDIERNVDFDGRGSRDRDRGARGGRDRDRGGRDRDRDRGGRDRDRDRGARDRDRGEARTSRRGGRTDRSRGSDRPATAERRETATSRRPEREEETGRSQRRNREERVEREPRQVRLPDPQPQVLPMARNASVNTADAMNNAGFVINPKKQHIVAIHEASGEITEGIVMEPYEMHELGIAVAVPKEDGIVIPLVDFTDTPEFLDKNSVKSKGGLAMVAEQQSVNDVMFSLGHMVSQVRNYQRNTVKDKDLIVPAVNVATFTLPKELYETFTTLREVATFEDYYKMLSAIRNYLANVNGEVGRTELSAMYMSFSTHLRNCLNEFFRINFSGQSIDSEFVVDWPDVRDFINDPDNRDVGDYFRAEERRYLAANAKYTMSDVRENGMFDVTVTARYLVMAYNKYFLGNTVLPSRRDVFCKVDAATTPEYYNACAKLMRLRNSQYEYSPVVMLDNNNIPVRVVSSRLEGSNVYIMVN